tara:strand:- start:2807 stop:3364 length:558 start_codon:yes stop_codon:yes gene_type:complete
MFGTVEVFQAIHIFGKLVLYMLQESDKITNSLKIYTSYGYIRKLSIVYFTYWLSLQLFIDVMNYKEYQYIIWILGLYIAILNNNKVVYFVRKYMNHMYFGKEYPTTNIEKEEFYKALKYLKLYENTEHEVFLKNLENVIRKKRRDSIKKVNLMMELKDGEGKWDDDDPRWQGDWTAIKKELNIND